MNKIKSYFKGLSRIHVLLTAFLFAALISTLVLIIYNFNILGHLIDYKRNAIRLRFAKILTFVSLGLLFLYFVVSIRKVKGSLNDGVALGLLLFGIFLFVYFYVARGGLNIRRIIFIFPIIGVSLIYIILRIFIAPETKPKKIYKKGSINSYFATLTSKYPLLFIGLFAIVLSCASYLFFSSGLIRFVIGSPLSVKTVVVACIFALPIIVYSVKSAFSKNITFFDAIIATGIIVFPISALQIYIKEYSQIKMILWAIGVMLFLISAILRLRFFDVTAEKKFVDNCKSKCYFGKLVRKYDLFSILSIAGICALVALIVLKTRGFQSTFALTSNTIKLAFKFFPFLLVTGSALFVLLACALISYVSAARKSVGNGDFALAVCDAFVVFGFLVYIAYPSAILLDLLIGFAVYAIATTIIRIVITTKN